VPVNAIVSSNHQLITISEDASSRPAKSLRRYPIRAVVPPLSVSYSTRLAHRLITSI